MYRNIFFLYHSLKQNNEWSYLPNPTTSEIRQWITCFLLISITERGFHQSSSIGDKTSKNIYADKVPDFYALII